MSVAAAAKALSGDQTGYDCPGSINSLSCSASSWARNLMSNSLSCRDKDCTSGSTSPSDINHTPRRPLITLIVFEYRIRHCYEFYSTDRRAS